MDEVTIRLRDEVQVEGQKYTVKHIHRVQGTEMTVLGLASKNRYPTTYINLYAERIL